MKIKKKVSKKIDIELDLDINLEEMADYIVNNDNNYEFLLLLQEKSNRKSKINSKDYSISNKVMFQKDENILNDEDFIKYIARLIKYENSDCLELLKEELNY